MAITPNKLRRLKKLKDEASLRNKQAKEATAKLNAFEAECFEGMEDADVDSMKTYGHLFVRVTKDYAQIQDRDAFVAWAQANEPELVQEKERKVELDKLVREKLDNGEALPPGVGFYTKRTISVRKAT